MNSFCQTKYYSVIGNRDHIKIKGDKRPFWEFLDKQPDGYLSSLAYLPAPYGFPDLPMIGDCGAWSYKNEKTPKLKKNLVTPEWVLEQYKKYFKPGDMVIAPDHMLIPGEGVDLSERRKFNLSSAKAFLPIANAEGFLPMATVHGMDLEERLVNIGRLYEMGYRHFAFGGLAARASQKKKLLSMIDSMSSRVRELLPDAWIHVLGLSSPDYFRRFPEMGIDSCDGSSHFKQAFTAGVFFAEEQGKLIKYKATRKGEEVTAPNCNCMACRKLKNEGIDTRSYGSNENNMGRAAHNLNMLMRAQQNTLTQTVALVSCVSVKAKEALPAQDFYLSAWFKKCRAYIEQCGLDWEIVSAKHGLVAIDSVLHPYDETLNDASAEQKKQWAKKVFLQVEEKYKTGTRFLIFAGQNYRSFLTPMLNEAGYHCEVPLEGLGIGQQLAWFDQKVQPRQLEFFDVANF